MAPSRPGRGAAGSKRRPGGPGGAARTSPRAGTGGAAPAMAERFRRQAPAVAFALLALYASYWGVKAFTEHRIGNYAVETDFYWKYGPAARDLLQGKVDIANYDSKGWGYPAVVALVSVPGIDPFRAAQILALLSAVVAAWLVFHTHRKLAGAGAALGSLLLLLGNETFLVNTYEVGTDMFFFAIAMGSIALLLARERPAWAAIVGSGLLAGWAFSTRYNGLFLLPGALAALLLLDPSRSPWRERLARAGGWTAAFALAALPWLVVNAIHTGNPLSNTNYLNVGYEVHGQGNWEQFFYGGDRKIDSFADVVMLDPGKFATVMARNVWGHLRQDLSDLLPVLWGVLVVAGGLLMIRDRPGRRTAGYAVFWALYFLTLVPVFYGTRFSMPLLAAYALLGAWPFVSPALGRMLAGVERSFPVRAVLFLALWIGPTMAAHRAVEDPRNPESVAHGPYEILPATDFLLENGKGEGLLARKPHAAYLAQMRFIPIPAVDSPAALHEVAVKERAKYVLVSSAEMGMRAAMRVFATGAEIPGFALAYDSPGALVFEVRPMPSAGRIPGAPENVPGGH
ncbi:MAG TPA: glycosyltransferase family 39 protein [Candidatus Eisenbacteria bacterium]|nr:glycosyltransferase family 39 protein [Candidatus Eisenbacteria bacterium]